MLAGTAQCGPNGENGIYTRPDGTKVIGTRGPFGNDFVGSVSLCVGEVATADVGHAMAFYKPGTQRKKSARAPEFPKVQSVSLEEGQPAKS